MLVYPPSYYDAYFVGIPGDVEFYADRLQEMDGPVLELGTGTGRVLVPVAETGVETWGIEPDAALLARARDRVQQAQAGVRERIRLLRGRMEELAVDERFAAVFLSYRTFQHLLTSVDQAETLSRIHAHLKPDGMLLMDMHDPLQEMLQEGLHSGLRFDTDFVDARSGHRVAVWYERHVDPLMQLLEQNFVFEEADEQGSSRGRLLAQLVLRYTPRHEMEYLFELSGFTVEELYGDFDRRPYPGFGNQVWVARKT